MNRIFSIFLGVFLLSFLIDISTSKIVDPNSQNAYAELIRDKRDDKNKTDDKGKDDKGKDDNASAAKYTQCSNLAGFCGDASICPTKCKQSKLGGNKCKDKDVCCACASPDDLKSEATPTPTPPPGCSDEGGVCADEEFCPKNCDKLKVQCLKGQVCCRCGELKLSSKGGNDEAAELVKLEV